LKQIEHRLSQKYDHLSWMKLSEIARYWAAKELTSITVHQNTIKLNAPFAAPDFTLKINAVVQKPIRNQGVPMKIVHKPSDLEANSMVTDKSGTRLCFDLKKGKTELAV
jgi:hypothetical protein